MSDPLIGRQINNFIIRGRLGQGGMASVYLAYQPSVNREVALKIITLNANPSERDEFRLRFAQEAQVIAGLEHVHILPVYDYGIYEDQIAYIAMRLLRGGTLAEQLHRPLSLDRTAEIFSQIALGLSYAHRKGVIHRDLKPSNIMFDDSGFAYLSDFGLAKIIENSLDLTRSDAVVGTPMYMSPEQLRGEALDNRTDIYSMGCILYHMLVGRQPFAASSTGIVGMVYQKLEKDPQPLREINPNIPPVVEQVVLKALSKNREDRFATADEMANALNRALGREVRSYAQEERAAAVPVVEDAPTMLDQGQVSTKSQPAVLDDSRTLIEPTPVPIAKHPLPPSTPNAAPISSSAVPQPRQRGSSRGIGVAAAVVVVLLIAVGIIFLNGQNGAAPTPTATATGAFVLAGSTEAVTSEVEPSAAPTNTEPAPSPSAVPTNTAAPTLAPTETEAASATVPAASTQAVAASGSGQGQIAFVSDRDGNNEIYLINLDGTGLTRLTDNPARDESPAWSPDGTQIAFTSYRDDDCCSAIYIMNADGSNQHPLLGEDRYSDFPSWSPDGTQIAITIWEGDGPQIYLVNPDGSNLRKVEGTPIYVGGAEWSPDGQSLVFVREENNNRDIYVMNLDGTGLLNISDSLAGDSHPSWSPVSDQIVFESDRTDANSMVYAMDSIGSDLRLLNEDHQDGYEPSWSPDGTQIVFASYRAGVGKQIHVMNADGSNVRLVTTGTESNNQMPAWRP